MFERFTTEARTAVTQAVAEAQRRGDRRVGTEHLLLGALHDDSAGRPIGIDLEMVRRALADLDETALAAVGVDARGIERAPVSAKRGHLPFTSGAKATLTRSLTEARRAKARRITTAHLLLGLVDGERNDPANEVLDTLGVDRAAMRAALG